MAKFPIERARGTLTEIAPTAKADIDVRTGAGILARGISGLGESIEKFELLQASTELSEFKRKVREEHNRLAISYDGNLDPNTFKSEFEKSLKVREGLIPKNRFAARSAREWLNERTPVWAEGVEESRKARISDNFKAGGFELKTEAERTGDTSKYFAHLRIGKILDVYDNEEIAKLKQETTDNAERSLINELIRKGQTNLAFEAVKESQLKQAEKRSLENTIRIAKKNLENNIKEQRQELINKTTSDTIREYFNDELSVVNLNQRHEAGLIKDSEFKFMMTGLSKEVPDDSDPFALGKIRRAMTSFKMGAVKRSEADNVILKEYLKLDGPDRSTVVADLEDIEEKIIATAKSNAYSEGVSLMSRRFVGIQSEEDLIDIFKGAGLTEEQKKRTNRQWRAEVNNRNLYERAVDDRFKEMRKERISDVDKFKSESLKILLQYERRVLLGLEEFEEVVTKEQRGIVREKGVGFLGEIPIVFSDSRVGVATEFSIGVQINGEETEIPTLVPTLNQNEFNLMVNDIIPNNKRVPDGIVKKATAHAKKRIRAGQSPFAQKGEQAARPVIIKPINKMTTAEKQKELQRIRELKKR